MLSSKLLALSRSSLAGLSGLNKGRFLSGSPTLYNSSSSSNNMNDANEDNFPSEEGGREDEYYNDDSQPQSRGREKYVNNVTLVGRVGRTPEVRGNNENPVIIFPLATNRPNNRRTGEPGKVDWHNIAVFSPNLQKYVGRGIHKGCRIYLEGEINYFNFIDSNGISRKSTSIVARSIINHTPNQYSPNDEE